MRGAVPFAAITIIDGALTQALSTTPATLDLSALGAANGDYTAGDSAARPDAANDRLILGPGTYEVELDLEGVTDGAQIITLTLAKNGSAISGTKRPQSWAVSTAKNLHNCKWLITLTADDVPGTISNFADPASTSYTGAGGATKQGIPITVLVSSGAGTPTITVEQMLLFAKRIG